jgi:hypothetical protein
VHERGVKLLPHHDIARLTIQFRKAFAKPMFNPRVNRAYSRCFPPITQGNIPVFHHRILATRFFKVDQQYFSTLQNVYSGVMKYHNDKESVFIGIL